VMDQHPIRGVILLVTCYRNWNKPETNEPATVQYTFLGISIQCTKRNRSLDRRLMSRQQSSTLFLAFQCTCTKRNRSLDREFLWVFLPRGINVLIVQNLSGCFESWLSMATKSLVISPCHQPTYFQLCISTFYPKRKL
jgi:hypothetical protein